MATYKCRDCSNEMIDSRQPYECDICGGRNLKLISDEITFNGGGGLVAIDKDLFSSSNFRATIQNYCRAIGWTISDINDRRAILRFTMESGTDQTLFIIRYENTLEFSCPSGLKFDDIDEIPHRLSTMLLCQNAEFKIGFWCIEEIGDRKVFSVMHNAEISLIDVNYFGKVVTKLVNDCDEFEQLIESAINN